MGDDRFPLPVSIIDEEHREIERAAVELTNAMVLGVSQDSLMISADDLVRVTRLHFEHEEAMLKRLEIAGLTGHAKGHKAILEMLRMVRKKLARREMAAAFHHLREYRTMLQQHLENEDEHYRAPLNQLEPHRCRHASAAWDSNAPHNELAGKTFAEEAEVFCWAEEYPP